jgi:succinate dehydrogenase / fumarate reductase cytochrome b subunit
MTRNPTRPMAPHLTVWKWGPHMLVSILHRITGVGLATLGAGLFTWWLVAAASGAEAYATFTAWATWKWALVVPVGLTWAAWQHILSGLRHFVMDTGAGYALPANRLWAWLTIAGAVLLTAATWAFIYWRAGA